MADVDAALAMPLRCLVEGEQPLGLRSSPATNDPGLHALLAKRQDSAASSASPECGVLTALAR